MPAELRRGAAAGALIRPADGRIGRDVAVLRAVVDGDGLRPQVPWRECGRNGQAPGRCSHTRSGAVYSIMSSATNQRCPTNVNDVVTPFAGTRRGRHEWHKRPAMRIEESDDGRCRRGLRFFSPTRRQCRRDRSGLPRAVLSSSCGDLLLSGVVGFSRRRVGKDGALMSQSTLFMSRPPRQES